MQLTAGMGYGSKLKIFKFIYSSITINSTIMKALRYFFLLAFLAIKSVAYSQEQIDSVKFFEDQSTINLTLEMDLKDLLSKKQRERYLPATITMAFQDGTSITEQIRVTVRGNFRRETCYMPGLKLNFHNPTSPRLYKLDKLKLSCGCSSGSDNEQLVLREYMAYKTYNLLTNKSFRVRLVNVTFKDVNGKKKPYTQYGFFIEDVDELAKRHNMVEVEGIQIIQEYTNREQATLVSIFEYMIGNTDWSFPNFHNIKLIGPKDDKTTRPIAVPYDFDISGFVDPPYATIAEIFEGQISTVRERLYRGFPRSMEELQVVIKVFNDKKEAIYNLINSFTPFDNKSKGWLTKFLDEFYKTINNPKNVQRYFIDEARTN